MRLQSAIFDMDGTLLDSMPIWRDLGTSVLRGLGIEPEPETDEMLKTLSLRHGIAYCKEHYHLPQTEEELIGRVVDRVADFYQHEVQAKPGVDKFLSLLKMEGVWMYVATATDRPLAEAALRHAGIDHYFRGLITVAEVGVGKKESAEIYERAMRRLQSNKKDTVVFEDAFHAIQTAKAAGFRVAAVYDASEEAHQEEIRGLADYYIRSLRRCLRPGAGVIACLATEGPVPVRQDRAGFFVRESGSPPRGRRQMPSAYWRRPAAPCGNCRCPGLRPGAPPGGRRSSQKAEARAAAAAASGSTAANTPHSTDSIQPVPVTRDIRPLPPVTHQTRAPSVMRSSGPESSTAVPRRRARSMAVSLRASRLAGSGLSTPCSCPSDPSRARASPRFTRRMDGVNRSSSARTCPSRQGLAPTPTGSSTTG